MPRLIDPLSRTDVIVGVAQDLIAAGGVAAVTYRAIGSRMGLSASTLHDHYPDRRHLLKIVVAAVGEQREESFFGGVWRWTTPDTPGQKGLAAMIPEDEDDLRLARVWLALRDHARVEPLLAAVTDQVRDREREQIWRVLEGRVLEGRVLEGRVPDGGAGAATVTADQVEVVQALVEGLTGARTVGAEPMTHARAVQLLEATLTSLLGAAHAA